jgi:CRISPR-associated protein Cas1
MEQLTDLKAILHSKRANIFYLEKCRVMQKDGRVVFLTTDSIKKQYWNIPIANTTVILLGSGTSLTQAAVRMLASAGVLVGFCGGGGTPLLAGTAVEWMTPQSEYRPTEYVQGWLSFWFDEDKRLLVARDFQEIRMEFLETVWLKDRELQKEGFYGDDMEIESALTTCRQRTAEALCVEQLLLAEAALTKALYKYAANRVKIKEFVRDHNGADTANAFLNHGNYLAYGLAATVLWVLGIPHGFAVMHGKTRRGALVFDVADLIKDALVLPLAFICARQEMDEQGFRQQCLENFTRHKALNFMFETVKEISAKGGRQ